MAKFQKILVPFDFSDASTLALSYGLSLALEMEAELVLAHIVPFSPVLAYAYPIEGHAVSHEEMDGVRERLRGLVTRADHESLNVSVRVEAGDVRDELLTLIGAESPDLVVMGTHGRRRFERWALGSVTEHVLRRLRVPLLTVSHLDAEHQIDRPRPVRLEKVLYATDLSSESVEGTRRAIDLAQTFSAELIVMHVVQNLGWALGSEFVPLDLESRTQQAKDVAFEVLVKSVPESVRQDPKVRIELQEGVPFEVILEFAAKEEVDLIVLNTQSRSGLDRAILGSTAERVVRGATVPVLSIPGGLG